MPLNQTDLDFYYSLPEDLRDDWLFHRKACDKSLFHFIVEMGAFSKDAGGDSWRTPIWKQICDFWQDPTIKRKAVFMPRKWYKSTNLSVMGNLWSYLQDNGTRILMPSQKIDLPKSFIKTIKERVASNRRLRYLYPMLTKIDAKWKHEHIWGAESCEFPGHQGQPDPTFKAIGVTGGAQGGHAPIIAPDDIVGEKAMESKAVLIDAQRWFDNIEELTTDFDVEKEGGSVIRITGTFWGPGDIGCYIQDNYPAYKWMVVPALKDDSLENTKNVTWLQDPEVPNGQSNWEWNVSTKTYLDMKNNPEKSVIFWSQHMNNPHKADAFTAFDKHWLKFYRWEEDSTGRWIVCNDDKQRFKLGSFLTFGFVDPGGFSTKTISKKGGSRSAVLIGGQPRGSFKKFVTYTWCGQFKEPKVFLDEIFKAHASMNPYLWRQEIYGQQDYILKDIKSEAQVRKVPLRIIELESDVSKDAKDSRIQALIKPMFNGEIYVHESMRELISEINDYPGGMTKDLLDLLAQINQTYFTRGEKPALKQSNDIPEQVSGSNEITGY